MGPMLRFPLLATALLVLGACGSGSSDSAATTTPPEVTLLSTTTTSTTTSTSTTTTTTSTTTTTTTTTSTTLPPETTTTVDPMIDALLLGAEGIGSATFGSDPEGVVSYVTTLLGSPTQDTDWVDPLTLGPCPGEELRLVSWGALVLEFGDQSTVATGRRHFYSYQYGVDGEVGVPPIGLVTGQGVTTGSPVSELVAAYPEVVLNEEDEFISANFYVNDDLRGLVTGLDADDVVTLVAGGRTCRE